MLYLDLDGVFADFESHVCAVLGTHPSNIDDEEMWTRLHAVQGFYRNIPAMLGAGRLWAAVVDFQPVFLTGIPKPKRNMPFAAQEKILWVAKQYGDHVGVITCIAADKAKFCKPGDVLLDDRDINASKWRNAGGVFIQHDPYNIERSIQAVNAAMQLEDA